MTTKITYNPTPDPNNWILNLWLQKAKGAMINTLAVNGNVCTEISDSGLEITGVWIDEASKLSKKQIMYLSEKCLEIKLENTDAPKKQHKPRQNMPYWAKDWRGKKWP